jgi:hypothetical protein
VYVCVCTANRAPPLDTKLGFKMDRREREGWGRGRGESIIFHILKFLKSEKSGYIFSLFNPGGFMIQYTCMTTLCSFRTFTITSSVLIKASCALGAGHMITRQLSVFINTIVQMPY